MNIAVIGAGFCGLSVCYHLLQKGCRVTIFDVHGIGAGASGVASGLVHPYAGEQVRRSWRADEGMEATRELLEIAAKFLGQKVANYDGILRITNEEQKILFQKRQESFGDIKEIGENTFLITSGITVFSELYLKGLFRACEELGAELCIKKIESFEELQSFDQIVIAAGLGIKSLCPTVRVNSVKGQALTCRWPDHLEPLAMSMVSKGYIAKSPENGIFHCGATYEHVDSQEPDLHAALLDLEPKMAVFLKGSKLDVIECRAGVRVTNIGHYYPIVRRIDQKTYAIGAMGSRGLLYHAYLGKLLSLAIVSGDDNVLPQEVRVSPSKG